MDPPIGTPGRNGSGTGSSRDRDSDTSIGSSGSTGKKKKRKSVNRAQTTPMTPLQENDDSRSSAPPRILDSLDNSPNDQVIRHRQPSIHTHSITPLTNNDNSVPVMAPSVVAESHVVPSEPPSTPPAPKTSILLDNKENEQESEVLLPSSDPSPSSNSSLSIDTSTITLARSSTSSNGIPFRTPKTHPSPVSPHRRTLEGIRRITATVHSHSKPKANLKHHLQTSASTQGSLAPPPKRQRSASSPAISLLHLTKIPHSSSSSKQQVQPTSSTSNNALQNQQISQQSKQQQIQQQQQPSSQQPQQTRPAQQQSTNSTSSFTLWGELRNQIRNGKELFQDPHLIEESLLKAERIKNFVRVPVRLERLLMFGYLICLESFLAIFTTLPLQSLYAIKQLIFTSRRRSKDQQQPIDDTSAQYYRMILLKFFIFVVTVVLSQWVDVSYLYHSVRGQSVLKLYVIYNTLEICDKLLAAFGLDVVDTFFYSRSRQGFSWGLIGVVLLGIFYLSLHTLTLFFFLATLNVSINSYNNALLTLVLSNQFVEIKGSVFKRFEKETIFQLCCSDIVERFNLSVFLIIVFVRNYLELFPMSFNTILPFWDASFYYDLLLPILVVYVSEVIVDWIKHAFITKFNSISPNIYSLCGISLTKDLKLAAKRISFVPLPLAVLVMRVGYQTLQMVGFIGSEVVDENEEVATTVVSSTIEVGTTFLNSLWECVPAYETVVSFCMKSYEFALSASIFFGAALQDFYELYYETMVSMDLTNLGNWKMLGIGIYEWTIEYSVYVWGFLKELDWGGYAETIFSVSLSASIRCLLALKSIFGWWGLGLGTLWVALLLLKLSISKYLSSQQRQLMELQQRTSTKPTQQPTTPPISMTAATAANTTIVPETEKLDKAYGRWEFGRHQQKRVTTVTPFQPLTNSQLAGMDTSKIDHVQRFQMVKNRIV